MNGGYIELVNGDYKLTNVTGGGTTLFSEFKHFKQWGSFWRINGQQDQEFIES